MATSRLAPKLLFTPDELTGAAYEQVIARALEAGRIDGDAARRARWHAENKTARSSWPACKHGVRTGALDSDGQGLCPACWHERQRRTGAAEQAQAQEG